MNTGKKIALVGAGAMGANHARVVSQSKHAELSIVIDPFEKNGRALAETHNVQWAPTIDAIPADCSVILASATETHFDIAHQLIEAGHNLLIEKPLTPSLKTTQELVELSEAKGTVLMCGLLERFNPAVLTAQQMLTSPNHIVALRHSPFTPRIKTHVAWDLMIHDVDLVLRMFGCAPTNVTSFSAIGQSEGEVADVTDAILQFSHQNQALVSASRSGQRKIRNITVSEIGRQIEIDLLRRNVTIYHNVLESPLAEGSGYKQESIIEIPELITYVEPLSAQFSHFMKLIDGLADLSLERSSILPAHSVLQEIVN